MLIVPIFEYWLGYPIIFMPDKRRTLVFFKTLIVSVASSFLFIVLSITLAPIIVEFGLDVIDVIVNLGKWNHAELAKVLHISHKRVRTLKKKESMVTGHGNCGKMEAGSLLRSRSS